MPTYVSLLRFTQQGIQNIKESPDRVQASRQAFEAARRDGILPATPTRQEG